jgi:hypothetical protein
MSKEVITSKAHEFFFFLEFVDDSVCFSTVSDTGRAEGTSQGACAETNRDITQ